MGRRLAGATVPRACLLLGVALAMVGRPASAERADTWPGWRGLEREGRSESSGAPVRWSRQHNVAWSTEVPGEGYSSPVVTEEAVYVTAAREAPGLRDPATPYRWAVWGLLALLVIGAGAFAARACRAAAHTDTGQRPRPPVGFGVLVVSACWLVLFSEHFLGFGRGPERAWLAAGVLGTLSLAASGRPAGARGRALSGALLLLLAGLLQATVPNIAHAYEDGPVSPKSIFHYAVVAIPLVAGALVLAWRRRPAPASDGPGRPGRASWGRRASVALAVAVTAAIVVWMWIDQRQGELVISATPYEPRVPLWLPAALGGMAVAAWQLRRRRPSSEGAQAIDFAAGVAFWSVLIGVLWERLLAGSGYLQYQLGRPEFRPMLGQPGVWGLLGVGVVSFAAGLPLGARGGARYGAGLAWAVQGLATAVAAGFFVYAMYVPKGPVLLYQVVSLDRNTGKVNWTSRGVTGPRGPMHSDNAPATPTPATDGERIYAWFGTPGLTCVDGSGEQLWLNRDLPFRARHGVATSPILCDGKVIILSESESGCYLAAIDCVSGKEAWRTPRTQGTHRYAGTCRTPIVKTVAGRKTIIVWGYKDVSGYDPRSGREWWSHRVEAGGRGGNPVASPVVDDRRLYLVGLEAIVALDIDRLPGKDPPVAWQLDRATGVQCASPVLSNGLLFAVSDHGGAYCLDARTGSVVWEQRLPGVHYASPVAVGGRVYFCSTTGRTTVVEAARTYREVAASELGERVQASFAAADGRLFVRTASRVYCLQEGAEAPEAPTAGGEAATGRGGAAGATAPSAEAAAPAALGPNWPRFRGPSGSGAAASGQVPVKWNGPTGAGIRWRTPVPRPGNGSPIVWGDRVYCTGADRGVQEVYCFDAQAGTLLWTGDASGGTPMPEVSEMTGYAPSTPVTDGERVCAVFPNGVVVGFGRDGKRLWTRDLGAPENNYGHASSLVASGGLVFVQYDQGTEDDGKSRLLALNIASGNVAWKAERPTAASWTTPLLIETGQREELVTSAQPWVIAYDPAKGKEYWRAGCISGEVAPSPIYAGGLVFTVSDRASLSAIRPGGAGDVTASHVVWSSYDGLPDICSPVGNGELVFTLMTSGLLTCVQGADGVTVWQEQLDGTFRASPSLIGDRLYLVAESGETFVVAAGRQFEQLGRFPLGESVSASPAFTPGRLYLRGEKHLYCIGE